jgi:hypothetical protein
MRIMLPPYFGADPDMDRSAEMAGPLLEALRSLILTPACLGEGLAGILVEL